MLWKVQGKLRIHNLENIMFDLPKEPSARRKLSPRRLVLFAHTKVGKTTACSMLPNHLIVDLEDGSSYTEGIVLNVKEVVKQKETNPLSVLQELGKKLDAYYAENKSYPYDYLVVDTTSGLEEFARTYATILYRNTPIGKTFQGTDVVTELPNGAGYGWLRQAFDILLKPLEGKANKCVILVAHVKDSSIEKNGKDLKAKDLMLTGKLKQIVCADADAIGYMYRNTAGQTMISFKTSEQDLASGSRCEHLSGQEFCLLELENPDWVEKKEARRFINNWNKIFID